MEAHTHVSHRHHPALWGSLIMVVSEIFAFVVAFRQKAFFEQSQTEPPEISLGPILAYFFGVVLIIGAILFLVRTRYLGMVMRILFTFLFSWGAFVALSLSIAIPFAATIALAAGLMWFFSPRVWLHDLLLAMAVVSAGAVFGFLIPPWTAIFVMLVLSVYDAVAVGLKYMQWMAQKLSEFDALPAFVVPKHMSDWNLNLKDGGLRKLFDDTDEREFSILGGGDVGFPLLLIISVFYAWGLAGSVIVGFFALLGLMSAYGIQTFILKGRPVPALPPITVISLMGFAIAYFVFAA